MNLNLNSDGTTRFLTDDEQDQVDQIIDEAIYMNNEQRLHIAARMLGMVEDSENMPEAR